MREKANNARMHFPHEKQINPSAAAASNKLKEKKKVIGEKKLKKNIKREKNKYQIE